MSSSEEPGYPIRSPRKHEACEVCLTEKTAENKLLKCSACLRTYYCSKQCQATHWPLHKTMCKAMRAVREHIIATCGEDYQRRNDTWVSANVPAFAMIAHTMLKTAEERENFMVAIVAEYTENRNPYFRIQSMTKVPMVTLEAADPSLHRGILEHRKRNQVHHSQHMTAFIVLYVSNVDVYPRLMPMMCPSDLVSPLDNLELLAEVISNHQYKEKPKAAAK